MPTAGHRPLPTVFLLITNTQPGTVRVRAEDFIKERSMRSSVLRLMAAVVVVAGAAVSAHAQGSFFTSLSGTVVDTSGGVIPGADVRVKNNGTGAEFNTVSASDGGWTIPS